MSFGVANTHQMDRQKHAKVSKMINFSESLILCRIIQNQRTKSWCFTENSKRHTFAFEK